MTPPPNLCTTDQWSNFEAEVPPPRGKRPLFCPNETSSQEGGVGGILRSDPGSAPVAFVRSNRSERRRNNTWSFCLLKLLSGEMVNLDGSAPRVSLELRRSVKCHLRTVVWSKTTAQVDPGMGPGWVSGGFRGGCRVVRCHFRTVAWSKTSAPNGSAGGAGSGFWDWSTGWSRGRSLQGA